jgi:hypothetical protein
MKTKLRILVLSMLIFSLAGSHAADIRDAPVILSDGSTVAPSSAYMMTQMKANATNTEYAALSAPKMGIIALAGSMGGIPDPFMPGTGDGGETGGSSNVGEMPVGDVSLPIILSIIVLYTIYRSVTTSRRKGSL